jgi:sporulation protein YlmC with PRC-barrel domain
MKRIGDLLGKSIVSVAEGTRLGKLEGAMLDPQEGRIRYLRFDAEGHRANGVIPWEAVRSVGADAITVDSIQSARESIAACDRDRVLSSLGDLPVVTEGGERLGHIVDYDLDPATGQVLKYHVATGGFFGRITGREILVPAGAVRTIGKDAIIVANPSRGARAA